MFLDELSRSASEPMSCLAVLGLITVHQEGTRDTAWQVMHLRENGHFEDEPSLKQTVFP